MTTLLQLPGSCAVRQPAPTATGRNHLRITAVEPVVGLGEVRAQLLLSDWLVALVQAPAGRRYADLQAAFFLGAEWPPASFPAGYVLLGYLDPRDLAVG